MTTERRQLRVLAYALAFGTVAQIAACQTAAENLQTFIQDFAREVLQAVLL